MGAIATGGVRVLNDDIVQRLRIGPDVIEPVAQRALAELERRERSYRGNRHAPEVRGRTVILVDDGLATGSTMRAAVAALRRHAPACIVVAVPVGAAATCAGLATEADQVICGHMPDSFHAVGLWYQDFAQTSDDEVRELLARAGSLSA